MRESERAVEPAAPSPTLTVTSRSAVIPDASHLAERWDELAGRMRAAGKTMAATALEHATPVTVTARGDVTIALDEDNPIYEQALETVRLEIVAVLREWFGGVERVVVRASTTRSAAPARLTDEMVRAERLLAIRKRDPVLDRAIETLDLDLAD